MLHVVCIRAGTAFGPEYVDILHDSVRRNLADGFAGDFTVFTDQPDTYAPGVIVRPLPADLPGWWSKLALHKDWLFPPGERVLFLDLDSVICGRIDELAAYDGPFATLRDFYRPDGLQSAVMAWKAGETSDIWRSYEAQGCPQDDPCGDQAWIERDHLETAVRLQDELPGLFVSYKADNLQNHPPAKASVVVFHGKPRPSDVMTGWVPQVWKVGGMSRADLTTICNTEAEKLAANIRAAIALDIPWFDTAPEHDGHVCIIGGGPSLVDTLDELKWRQSIGQQVWALNGSAKFLAQNGIMVDALVIADARPENIGFVHGWCSPSVEYLLASQCDPAMFGLDKGTDVTLWHVNSEGTADILADEKERPVHLIGGGSTVGLNAMVLAFARGYRKIHLYGFDSSFKENHHAYAQPQNDGDQVIDALYGDRKFKTTAWMAQQVNEFQDLVPGLVADGCIITVAGEGLLQTVARDLAQNMPATPAQQRADAVLSRLNGAAKPKGVEIGVFAGEMSAALLRGNPKLHLDMVDSWEGAGAAYDGDSGDWHAELTQDSQNDFMQRALDRVAFAGERARVVRSRSAEAAQAVPDHSCDFVFIDADHSYQGCLADIEAWAPKVRPGGWLCGHDYDLPQFPKFGVTQAVTEYLARTGLSLDLGDNFTWFIKTRGEEDS